MLVMRKHTEELGQHCGIIIIYYYQNTLKDTEVQQEIHGVSVLVYLSSLILYSCQ